MGISNIFGLSNKAQLASIAMQQSTQDNLLKSTSTKTPENAFVNSMQPFYLGNNDGLKGKYISKIGFYVKTAPSVMSLVFKNVNEATAITQNDFTIDGTFCTITTNRTGWVEYDLTKPSADIVYFPENLTNGLIYIPSTGRIMGFGKNGEACNTGYSGSTYATVNPDMLFYNVSTGAFALGTLAFEIKETVPITSKGFYAGKNLSILGDSISTFTGWIPSGNANWYDGTNYGVSNVNQTWWKRLADSLGMNICVNNAWSSSRVTTTVDTPSAGCMSRATALHSTTSNPDVIIVYMGINDFNNGVAIGTYDGSQAFPTVTTTFRESYAIMLSKILSQYKMAEVYVCTLPYCERTGSATFPEANSNAVLLAQWNKAIRDLADLFGVGIIELSKCGLTWQNMNMYMGDWDYNTGKGLHPNARGHKIMANKAIKELGMSLKYSTV